MKSGKGEIVQMTKEMMIKKLEARRDLLKARNEMMNLNIIHKIERQIRKLSD